MTLIDIELVSFDGEDAKRIQINKIFSDAGFDKIKIVITDGKDFLEDVTIDTANATEFAYVIDMICKDSLAYKLGRQEENVIGEEYRKGNNKIYR